MKADVLTVVVVLFSLGVLVSSVGLTDVFDSEPTQPVAPLHQGVQR